MNAVSIIGLCFSGFVLLCSVFTLIITGKRNTKKDAEDDEHKLSTLSEGILKANIKLEQICTTTNQTQLDVKSMNDTSNKHSERLILLERDVAELKKNGGLS